LARAYYSAGRIAEAEKTMQKALLGGADFADGEDAKRFIALADAFGSASNVQAATGQAQTILQADAKYVPALMVIATAAEGGGNFKVAQETYGKALAIFPRFSPAARQLALLDARHFVDDPAGYPLAEKARAAYPDDPEVAGSLGILSYYQSRYPKSVGLLQEGMAKNADDGQLYYYLGMDYYQLQRRKESKEALERSLTLMIPDKLAANAKRILADLK
jgi:tetratricopeptide (TPR) repeat protein